MNIDKHESEMVKITCTDTGITSEAEVWKRHPNGDISMLLENSIKMAMTDLLVGLGVRTPGRRFIRACDLKFLMFWMSR